MSAGNADVLDALLEMIAARVVEKLAGVQRAPDTPPSASAWLTIPQAAAYLGVQQKTLEGWRCRGVGPASGRAGRGVRYNRAVLDDFIRASGRGAA